jgi:hypothetical protein
VNPGGRTSRPSSSLAMRRPVATACHLFVRPSRTLTINTASARRPTTPRPARLEPQGSARSSISAHRLLALAELPRPPGGQRDRWRWRGVYSTLPPSNPMRATTPIFTSSKQKSAV